MARRTQSAFQTIKTYAISHGWGRAPIHLVSFRYDLDRSAPSVYRVRRVILEINDEMAEAASKGVREQGKAVPWFLTP